MAPALLLYLQLHGSLIAAPMVVASTTDDSCTFTARFAIGCAPRCACESEMLHVAAHAKRSSFIVGVRGAVAEASEQLTQFEHRIFELRAEVRRADA